MTIQLLENKPFSNTTQNTASIRKKIRSVMEAFDTIAYTCVVDDQGYIVRMNDRFAALLGFLGQTSTQISILPFLRTTRLDRTAVLIRRSIRGNEPFRKELSLNDGTDQPRWFDIHVVPRHDENGNQIGAVAILLDITERKLVEEAMAFHAYHDTLTGLPNRRRLAERLNQIQLRAERLGEKYAVLFLDLDRFKEVNDTHGHRAGDFVLIEVAHRIRSILRKDDALCRQGGDEFIIVLPGIHHPADVINVAEKLITSLSQPIAVDNFMCRIGASIGISLFPEHDRRSDRLIQLADKALYKAKVRGRGSYAFVDEIGTATNKIMMPLRHKPITEIISIPESIHSELIHLMKQAGISGNRLSLLIEN